MTDRFLPTRKKTFLFFSMLLSLGLYACQTAPTNSENAHYGHVDNALHKASEKAAKSGKQLQSLSYQEKLYSRNSDDPQIALDFATALRQNDFLLRADTVLKPFADKDSSSPDIHSEYAAIKLAQGQFKSAQKYAWRAVKKDDKHARAQHYLGIALDAQDKHEAAEKSLRTALELWDGDPTTVMNNLALCLTAQNKLDEAQDILEQAQAIDPNKIELERNMRIVKALKESSSYTYKKSEKDAEDVEALDAVPVPNVKPKN